MNILHTLTKINNYFTQINIFSKDYIKNFSIINLIKCTTNSFNYKNAELVTTYADGKITFETDHFSVYAIAVKADVITAKPVKPAKPDTSLPQTGDTTPIGIIFILVVISYVCVILRKKLCK